MDTFVIAVLVGGISVLLVFGLLIALDKGKQPVSSTGSSAKVGGRR